MIEDEEYLNDALYPDDDFGPYEEEDHIDGRLISCEPRMLGTSLAARPCYRLLSGWNVELFNVHRPSSSIEIRASDVGDAIRLLRGTRRRLRWSRFKDVARNPLASARAWLRRQRHEWSLWWLFFSLRLAHHRREGRSWPMSLTKSLTKSLRGS